MFHKSKKAKLSIIKFAKDTIRKEIQLFLRRHSVLDDNTTMDNIKQFEWSKLIQETNTVPLLKETVLAALTTQSTEKKILS